MAFLKVRTIRIAWEEFEKGADKFLDDFNREARFSLSTTTNENVTF